jgi:excisionase family DNA binding protein
MKNTVVKNAVSLGGENGALEPLVTVNEAAEILRCSRHSLNRWRLVGGGPRFVRVGRRVRYRRTDLAAFIAASTRISTSDPGEPAAATAA